MSMNKTCAISSWISFLISADIKHSEKEVAQRENHRWTAERRAQLEFYIATGPRGQCFPDSFFTIASDLNRRRCFSPYSLNRINRSTQVQGTLPANGRGRAGAGRRRRRLIRQVKRA